MIFPQKHLPAPYAKMIAGVLLLVTAGCSDTAPIRAYTVEAEQPQLRTSDVLRREFGTLPFDWKVPGSWQLADNDRFSKVAWQVGGKLDGARITVSEVSMGMGVVSQITRWRGQVGITLPPEENPMKDTEQMKVDGRPATYMSFHGPKGSILGLMLPIDNALWVVKLRGETETAKDQESAFRTFCESIRILAEEQE